MTGALIGGVVLVANGVLCPVDLLVWARGSGHDRSRAWRGVARGEIIDRLIVRNRRWVRQLPVVGRKAEGRFGVTMALRSGWRMRDTRSRMEEKGGNHETDRGDVLFLPKSS